MKFFSDKVVFYVCKSVTVRWIKFHNAPKITALVCWISCGSWHVCQLVLHLLIQIKLEIRLLKLYSILDHKLDWNLVSKLESKLDSKLDPKLDF